MSGVDRDARFKALLAAHEGAIYRLTRFRERDPHARRDLEQEIALALWRSLDSFRGDASERTWVLRVAHNVAVTHALRARTEKSRSGGTLDEAMHARAPGPNPEARAIDRARLTRLEAQIRALDLVEQSIVLLHLEGLSSQEIAEVTGLTATNVTTKLSRVRAGLAARDSEEA